MNILRLTAISLFIMNSCKPNVGNVEIKNHSSYCTFPNYQEYCNIYVPNAAKVGTFDISIQNHKDSTFLVRSNNPNFPESNLFKSKFYLIYNDSVLRLNMDDSEKYFDSNVSSGFIQLFLYIPSQYIKNKTDCLDENAFHELKKEIDEAIRYGTIVYIPNEEDYKDKTCQGICFLRNPILIERDLKKIFVEQYYVTE